MIAIIELGLSLVGLVAIAIIGRRMVRKTEAGSPRQVFSPSGPVSLPRPIECWERPHP